MIGGWLLEQEEVGDGRWALSQFEATKEVYRAGAGLQLESEDRLRKLVPKQLNPSSWPRCPGDFDLCIWPLYPPFSWAKNGEGDNFLFLNFLFLLVSFNGRERGGGLICQVGRGGEICKITSWFTWLCSCCKIRLFMSRAGSFYSLSFCNQILIFL